MFDYLRAECYKLRHRNYTYWALLTLLGCVLLLMCLWWITNSWGGHIELPGALYTLVMLLQIGLYAPIITTDIVFSEQYKLGTLKNEVSYGIPRTRIYLGKLAVGLAASVVAFLLAVGLYLVLCVLTLPLGPDPDGMIMVTVQEMWQLVGRALGSAFPLWIGAQGVCYMCMSNMKGGNSGPFSAIGIIAVIPGVLKVLGMLLHPVFVTVIRHYTLVAPMDNWDYPVWECWAIGLGWFVVSTLIGMFLFQKRELN